jgi:hypothetical protein
MSEVLVSSLHQETSGRLSVAYCMFLAWRISAASKCYAWSIIQLNGKLGDLKLDSRDVEADVNG